MASITGTVTTLLILLTIVGRSGDGRPIELIHVAGPGPRVLVVGSIHGNEPAGIAVVRALEHAHPSADLWLVPDLNPDGHAADTRENAHGVDLNRDFGTFTQRESRVARSVIRRVQPRYTIWFHQHLDVVWAYGRSTAAGRAYARLARMRFYHHVWEPSSGTNWQNHLPGGGASFTVELPAGQLSAAGVGRQVRAVLKLPFA
jgi:murein peptide amidase A